MTLKRPCFALPLFSKYRLLNTEHNITFTDWSRTNLDFLYILSSYTYMISMEAEIPPTYKRKNFKDKKAKWRTRNPTRVPETPKRGSSPIKTFLFQFLQSSERQTIQQFFSSIIPTFVIIYTTFNYQKSGFLLFQIYHFFSFSMWI